MSADGGRRALAAVEMPFVIPRGPAIACRVKSRPEDFVVEEDIGFEPDGAGDYLMVRVEKRGLSMEQMISRVRSGTGCGQAEIGFAGLKDRMAVTRQWISLPSTYLCRLGDFEGPGLKVLDVAHHSAALKTGQLRGNRFRILLRGAGRPLLKPVKEMLAVLEASGLANVYGPQRFGQDYEAARVGLDVVLGRMECAGMSRLKRRFVVSALQGHLFNRYVFLRHQSVGLRTVVPGDIVRNEVGELRGTGRSQDEQRRVERGASMITGPIYGRNMLRAEQRAAGFEAEVLAEAGLSMAQFEAFQTIGGGSRRNLIFRPSEVRAESGGEGIRLDFFLPAGSYATVVLRELLRREVK